MLSLAGPVDEVRGYATTTQMHRMETEDLVCAAVRFANGAYGTLDATTTSFPGFPERIEIVATAATALLSGTELKIFHHDGRVVEVRPDASAGGTGADPMAFPHDYHRALIGDFLDAIENDRVPAVSGAEALKVHRLIDALLAAPASDRAVKVA
jgi:predicted dehydrogenase